MHFMLDSRSLPEKFAYSAKSFNGSYTQPVQSIAHSYAHLSKRNYIFPSTFMSSKRVFHFRKKSSHFSDTNQHVTFWGMLDTSRQDR